MSETTPGCGSNSEARKRQAEATTPDDRDDTPTDAERGDLRPRAAKAEAWDEGYSTCLGDFDIAARRGARSSNPYRADALDAEAAELGGGS